jgi:myo-inositol 2-dehydrogenase / D-chiro-inositol 1-dehydrogenase
MEDLIAASKTVSAALATGQIGTPLAVRVVSHLSADHGPLERVAARTLEIASAWLTSRLDQLTAMGGAEGGQISTLARFAGGQTALVSVGSRGVGPPLLEIVVTGNRGVLSWEGQSGAFAVRDEGKEPELSEQSRQFLKRIRESLDSGRSKTGGPAKSDRFTPSPSPAHAAAKPRAQKPPYGVLLVSGDHTHQPAYAAALAADKRCRLIGLTDEADVTPRRRELNERLARRLAIPVLPDLDAALARDDVHIVSICAEPRRRGRIIVQAAQAGKHLYLDKPLAASLRDAERIVAAGREAGVVIQMWSLVRSEAASRTRELVRSGRLGELKAVHCDLTFAKGPAGTARLGKPRKEAAVPEVYELVDSKRELTNVGVYPLVMLLWLTGRQVRRVRATTGNYFFQEHQKNDMEDFGQMLLDMEGGLTATISAGRTGWRSHPSGGLNRTCLIGTNGTAVIDAHRPRAAVWADVESWRAPQRDPEDPMGMWGGPKAEPYAPRAKQSWITPAADEQSADVGYFLDCIAGGRESDVSASVTAHATEVLLAGYQSAQSGRVVDLPLPRTAP